MKELDKDALLEEAKRRYPIGTRVKCLLTNNIDKINDDWKIKNNQIINNNLTIFIW